MKKLILIAILMATTGTVISQTQKFFFVSGTPTLNQYAQWVDDTTLKGVASVDTLATGAVDAIGEIASGLKSGTAATLVTGTAGTAGNCMEWDANGDAVDAGTTCGSGSVTVSGTPADGQVPVWTSASDLEGDANFTFDTTDDSLTSVGGYRMSAGAGLTCTNGVYAVYAKTADNKMKKCVDGVETNVSANTDINRDVLLDAFAIDVDVSVGDEAARFFVPISMNGMNLTDIECHVDTAGTTGTTDIQIRNVTQAADMLTTKVTIDSGETSSLTAAAAPVIDAANDDVATGDKVRIDIDAASTTAPKGMQCGLTFATP